MSLLPTCVVCDALLKTSGETRCERCKEPCPTCGGNVSQCQHPLSSREEAAELRLRKTVERDLAFTLQAKARAA